MTFVGPRGRIVVDGVMSVTMTEFRFLTPVVTQMDSTMMVALICLPRRRARYKKYTVQRSDTSS